MSIQKYEIQCGKVEVGDLVSINSITNQVKIAFKEFLTSTNEIIRYL